MRRRAAHSSLIGAASVLLGSLLSATPVLAQIAPLALDDQYPAVEDEILTHSASSGVRANDTDPDGPRNDLEVAVWGTPTHGTLSPNDNNRGGFTYVPNANFNGTDSFTYQLVDADGLRSNVATVTITVSPVNDAPTGVVNRPYSTGENVPLAVAAPGVLAGVTDVDGDTVSAVLVTNVSEAAGMVSLNSDGAFLYSPAAGFSGFATFTYRAVDNATPPAQSNTATVTIEVRPLNDPPVANGETYAAREDTVLTVAVPGVLSNDDDPDNDPLTAVRVAPPAHGALTLNANGSFTYAPEANYHGPDAFRYRAQDNGTPPLQSGEATVTINVAPVNDAPRFAAGYTTIPNQTATENVPFTLALAQFFVDPEGSPLTFTVTGLPAGLTATSDGVIGGTPAALATGTRTVSVSVSDGQSQLPSTFTMTVLAGGRTDLALSAAAAPSPALINEAITWTFTIDNRSSVENVGNLSLQVVFVGPASFAVSPASGCTATPQADRTTVACTAGPVLANGRLTIAINGSGAQAGDAVATATVAITDSVPVDSTPDNNTTTTTVNIAPTVAARPAQTLTATGLRAAAGGDFNGDGFVDLAVATEGGGGTLVYPNVLDPNTPGGTKRALATQPTALGDAGVSTSIAVADLDGDGALDLVVAKSPGPSIVLRNRNDGTFAFVAVPNALGSVADASTSVAARDLDGNGRVDVVLANRGANRVFMNQGSGVFAALPGLGNDDSRDVAIADLAGDAALELVFANANRGATLYSFDRATGRYQGEIVLATGATTSVAAGDFNANGRVDLVFGRPQSKVALFNVTPAGAALQLAFPPLELDAVPTTDVLTSDTDADGDIDIVGINTSGNHQLHENNGAGQFIPRPQQFASTGPRNATAAKLSVDERIDLAVVGTSSLDVFYNDGTGNFGRGDTGAPTIQLRGEASVELAVESTYTDAGATASDSVDGDITARIRVDNPVNPAVVGTYTVTYSVADTSGNTAAPVTRTVRVGVRSGTGGGGGGSLDLLSLLVLAALTLFAIVRTSITRRSVS